MKDSIKRLLEEFLQFSDIDFHEIEIHEEEENVLRYNMRVPNPPGVIRKQGKGLFAIQHVFRLVVQNQHPDIEYKIIIDVDNYRKNQEENAIFIAKEKAQKLLDGLDEYTFHPQPSYIRRVIHTHINDNYPQIETESVGSGDERRLVLRIKS